MSCIILYIQQLESSFIVIVSFYPFILHCYVFCLSFYCLLSCFFLSFPTLSNLALHYFHFVIVILSCILYLVLFCFVLAY